MLELKKEKHLHFVVFEDNDQRSSCFWLKMRENEIKIINWYIMISLCR